MKSQGQKSKYACFKETHMGVNKLKEMNHFKHSLPYFI